MAKKTSNDDGWEELFRLMRAGKVSPNSDGFYVVDKTYKSATPKQSTVKLVSPVAQTLERAKEKRKKEKKDKLS